MKKLICFIPTIFICVFYGIMELIFDLEPIAYVWLFLIIFTGIAFIKDKWWGCISGILAGIWLIYMDIKVSGQVIKQWPLGLSICIYYLICGIVLFKAKKEL